MAKEQLLFAEHLAKTYRKNGRSLRVLQDVSLRLMQGEILGIVGESGSGKSTLLRQIACLEHPDSGQIFLNGREITHSRISEICGEMQMIFQDPIASFPARRRVGTVLEEAILQVGHRKKEEAAARAAELMQLTGLSAELLERYPAELSGGQCQRMAIARALAAEPELLLCDECTSALDPLVQKQILELLRGLNRREGLSMLFVSHDPVVVRSLCSRILRIEAGKCQVCERSEVPFLEGKLP